MDWFIPGSGESAAFPLTLSRSDWWNQDPLFRFFEREVKMGGKMLQEVRQDLTDVVGVCEGKKKQTNDLRTLISDLVKGV